MSGERESKGCLAYKLVCLPAVLWLLELIVLLTRCSDLLWFANLVPPLFIMLSCPIIGYKQVKNDSFSIWSPIPWFLLSCSLFCGLGPLLLLFGNNDSISYANEYFAIDGFMLLRTNILNTVGISVVLLSTCLFHKLTRFKKQNWLLPLKSYPLKKVSSVFLFVGLLLQFAFSWPYKLGLLQCTLPGIITTFADLGSQSVILLYILSKKDNKYKIFLWILLFMELVTSAMTFSKTEVIMVLLYLVIAVYTYKKDLNKLIGWAVSIFVLYVFVLSPFVLAARIYKSPAGVSSLTAFYDAIVNYRYVKPVDLYGEMIHVQGWWTRLNYANAQAFAMNEYDHGRRGKSLLLAVYTFVPRFIFPEKPEIPMGHYFNGIATGNYYSNSAPGIFGEAYWNGGWVCLVLVSIIYSLFLSFFNRYSVCHLRNGNYLYVPVAIIGIKMGLQMNGWMVPVTIGSFLHAIFMYFILGQVVMPVTEMLSIKPGK